MKRTMAGGTAPGQTICAASASIGCVAFIALRRCFSSSSLVIGVASIDIAELPVLFGARVPRIPIAIFSRLYASLLAAAWFKGIARDPTIDDLDDAVALIRDA